jgi:hypothetical protein
MAVKVYRQVRTRNLAALPALGKCLADYQNPVPREVLRAQIRLAAQEATDLDFVPTLFRAP